MPDLSITLSLVLGFVLLIVGGEILVRGAVAIAERMKLSPLFIGITLVGFGTSMPELVTSVQASIAGSPGIAIGSFVGSNISNILLVIGTSALIMPLAANPQGLARDGTVVLAVAITFTILSALTPLNPIVGGAYLISLLAYLTFAYWIEVKRAPIGHTAPVDIVQAQPTLSNEPELLSRQHASYTAHLGWILPLLMTIAGIATIVLGGKLLVTGAIGLAQSLGVSETVIGLTVVAIGTSAPELATSIIATIRQHSDVAIGNILGSNIYNILGIGGVVGILAPTDVPRQIITFDNPVMIAATLGLFALTLVAKGKIPRIGGLVLLSAYALYLWSVWPN